MGGDENGGVDAAKQTKNEKIYDAALTYECVGTMVGTIVGTVVGTRRVFWRFVAFFTNSYERKA